MLLRVWVRLYACQQLLHSGQHDDAALAFFHELFCVVEQVKLKLIGVGLDFRLAEGSASLMGTSARRAAHI